MSALSDLITNKNRIVSTAMDIKSAIINKGVSNVGNDISEYASLIGSIPQTDASGIRVYTNHPLLSHRFTVTSITQNTPIRQILTPVSGGSKTSEYFRIDTSVSGNEKAIVLQRCAMLVEACMHVGTDALDSGSSFGYVEPFYVRDGETKTITSFLDIYTMQNIGIASIVQFREGDEFYVRGGITMPTKNVTSGSTKPLVYGSVLTWLLYDN